MDKPPPFTTTCPVRHPNRVTHELALIRAIPGRGALYECPTGYYRFLHIYATGAVIRFKRPHWGWRAE
jgi:hypothetical protein